MAVITWPGSLSAPMNFNIRSLEYVVKDRSDWTYGAEVMHRSHQWHVMMTWNHLTHTQGHVAKAHFGRSRGGVNIFEIPIFDYRAKIGTKTGTVTLDGAHSAGVTSLTITGGGGLFAAGDWGWLTENSIKRAYQIISAESGSVIQINPGLRSSRSNGTTFHHFAEGVIYDTMELPTDFDAPSIMPSPLPGIFQPFTVELVTALRG